MSRKPIFAATHPRACSTAFERVFMTQRDTLECLHEPFGDAFYYGPERISPRYEDDEKDRIASGYAESTYKTIVDRIEHEAAKDKRVFIKDIMYYLFPVGQQESHIAPSLQTIKRGVGTDDAKDSATTNGTKPGSAPYPYSTAAEPGNPTVVPKSILEKFHFTFLIRHPRSSIPSFVRCCEPPLHERTRWDNFMDEEAGYSELRRFFDYCKDSGFVGPRIADRDEVGGDGIEICVIDADDLLDDPETIIKKYCKAVGLTFSPTMLVWDDDESHQFAKQTFMKWDGWHDDAINSKDLKPRAHKKAPKSDEQLFAEWKASFGDERAQRMKNLVDANVPHYEYLKQFAIKL